MRFVCINVRFFVLLMCWNRFQHTDRQDERQRRGKPSGKHESWDTQVVEPEENAFSFPCLCWRAWLTAHFLCLKKGEECPEKDDEPIQAHTHEGYTSLRRGVFRKG
jgi:hypothetical protein